MRTIRLLSLLALLAFAGCEYRPITNDDAKPAGESLVVLMVEETAEPFPGRLDYRTSKAFHDALKAKGHVWRMVDQDVTGPDGQPPRDVAPFIADAKARSLPWVYLASRRTGKTIWSGKPPAKPDLLLETISKHE